MKKALIFIFLILLSACSTSIPTESDQPGTHSVATVLDPTPTTDPRMGQIEGQMLVKGQPVTAGILYLSELIKDNTGRELVASFSRESRLRAYFDENGKFTFWNVPPGRYGVVYDLVSSAYLLMTIDGEASFIVTVTEGETLDLGILDYPNLPNETE